MLPFQQPHPSCERLEPQLSERSLLRTNLQPLKGTAMAIAEGTPLTPWPPKTKIIAEATDAKAASGATAAPMFAQPNAIICKVPPKNNSGF